MGFEEELEDPVREDDPGQKKSIDKFSDTYVNRKLRLLGSVIRAENEDPIRQVTLKPSTATRTKVHHRRVGKPRHDWVQEGMKKVWKITHEVDQSDSRHPFRRRVYKGNKQQRLNILEWAIDKRF